MDKNDIKSDPLLQKIARYVIGFQSKSSLAYDTARYCLMDSLGCAILALGFPQCTQILGPIIPGAEMEKGSRIPGTAYVLDPVQAAFNTTAMIRWLDYNDTWLAAEWGHPSDNLGAILAVTDYINRQKKHRNSPFTVKDVLTAMIKAYEIQGVLALENGFNHVGLDHVILVKVASAALAAFLLGGSENDIINAVSQAWIDGHALRTYRHAPNTGSRKCWAAADASSRGVWLALLTLKGEMGYATPLSAPKWGFQDVYLKGKSVVLSQPLGSYVMENILFKISYPAEFHAQTAVEAAVQLHTQVKSYLEDIQEIRIWTQEPAIRIIDKKGPLNNPSDRDHCLQYMVAIALLFGDLKAEYYSNAAAKDSRIDSLREKMVVVEDPQYSRDYLDPDKRSIPNAIQIMFTNGKKTKKVEGEYPIGHPFRRKEGIPLLLQKFRTNLKTHFSENHVNQIEAVFQKPKLLDSLPINEFIDLFLSC